MRTNSIARSTVGAVLEGILVLAILGALVIGVGVMLTGAPGNASSALAARGGNGHGHTTQATVTAWVSATPGDVAAGGARVDVSGCGYAFVPVEIRIVHSAAGGTEAFMVGVWNTGCMAGTYFVTQEAGIYTVEAYQGASLLAFTTVGVH